ncbi:MAG TPA: amylo-alpha-1,6-glucosidase [Thermoanaerobaculia bacterium]|nr:amylo-alpha-1,6-glucosidase [Thermoanaerobaculia bacterium]
MRAKSIHPLVTPREVCRDRDAAAAREWLETNGLGGYAMGTASGENTRRYHGLLVAATKPPVGRVVLLSKLEETLVVDGRRTDLSTNRFPGATHPEGFRFLTDFRKRPFPTFTWDVDGVVLEKEVFMPHGEDAVWVTWRVLARGTRAGPIGLEVRPLVAFRDFHALTHENDDLDRTVEISEGNVRMAPYGGLPELFIAHDGAAEQAGDWYRSFEYEEERARGFDFREDLWHPVTLSFSFEENPGGGSAAAGAARRSANLVASTSPRSASDIHLLRKKEFSRRESIGLRALKNEIDVFVPVLARAADQFLVARGDLTTVIAGYPWFSDWGRDTMISLPGLTLTTGRPEVAREILLAFSEHVDQGMLPNRFPDAGEEPEYNTVDATLWYFEAVRQYVEATGDLALVGERLFGVLADVVAWHERGTRYGIRVDEDGLLASGADGQQLTWMDARVHGRVITPRRGKPVEIQALWFNALRTMSDFARRIGEKTSARGFEERAELCRSTFLRIFPDEVGGGGLADCVDGSFRDSSIRPNQLFAVSLHHSMIPKPLARRVLSVVEEHLLTPYGLRTLSPRDSAYRGRYEGGPEERDSAYHQGTVWPWLLGPYVTAFLKVFGRGPTALFKAKAALGPLCEFLLGPGLGQLPEIFDGDPPHRPRGCVAQAWSVAELLRALCLLSAG